MDELQIQVAIYTTFLQRLNSEQETGQWLLRTRRAGD